MYKIVGTYYGRGNVALRKSKDGFIAMDKILGKYYRSGYVALTKN